MSAKSLMGNPAVIVGQPPYDFSKIVLGEIVGWADTSPEHVAIYVGKAEPKPFIDVRSPKDADGVVYKPRNLTQWESKRTVYKSAKY